MTMNTKKCFKHNVKIPNSQSKLSPIIRLEYMYCDHPIMLLGAMFRDVYCMTIMPKASGFLFQHFDSKYAITNAFNALKVQIGIANCRNV